MSSIKSGYLSGILFMKVPYLRIPLVLAFFAEPSRITTLRCIKLQRVLDACLFEPGPWRSPLYDAKIDTQIPARTRAPLATPSGLLLNELMHQRRVTLNEKVRAIALRCARLSVLLQHALHQPHLA